MVPYNTRDIAPVKIVPLTIVMRTNQNIPLVSISRLQILVKMSLELQNKIIRNSKYISLCLAPHQNDAVVAIDTETFEIQHLTMKKYRKQKELSYLFPYKSRMQYSIFSKWPYLKGKPSNYHLLRISQNSYSSTTASF